MISKSLADQLVNAHLPADLLAARLSTGAGQHDAWWHQEFGPVDIAVAGDMNHPGRARAVLNLNDEPANLTEQDFSASWRDWLLMATILGFRDPNRTAIVSNESAADILRIDVAVPSPTTVVELPERQEISAEWLQAIDEAFEGTEQDFVTRLAQENIDVPEIGFETTAGLMIDIGWPETKIAVLLEDPTEKDIQSLQEEGWNVLVSPEPQDVVKVVKGS